MWRGSRRLRDTILSQLFQGSWYDRGHRVFDRVFGRSRRTIAALLAAALLAGCAPSSGGQGGLAPATPPVGSPTALASPGPGAVVTPRAAPSSTVTSTPVPAVVVTPTAAQSATATSTPVPAEIVTQTPAEAAGNAAAAGERRYVFPVQPVEAASYASCHHDYPASDIFAPAGSEFVAVTDGVVDFVSGEDRWSRADDDPALRGGISVAIVGADGVRYYGSHLSEVAPGIAPGVRVMAGQLLGRTGASGNAAGTDPHLHFGISRPTTPDDWAVRRGQVNPRPYLDAWREGRAVTPDLSRTGEGVC